MLDDRAFAAAAGTLGCPLSSEQIDRFRRYEDRLQDWSGRVRLVSRGDRDRLRERHFLDCLAVVPYLAQAPFRLLDLGSGAGLPGIPIKIARPDIQVDLLEATRMKALFLRGIREDLGMGGLKVIRARAEEIARKAAHRASYRVVSIRGVGPLPLLWALAAPFLQPGGVLVAFKGPGALSEFGDAPPAGVTATEQVLRIPTLKRARAFVFVGFEGGGRLTDGDSLL